MELYSTLRTNPWSLGERKRTNVPTDLLYQYTCPKCSLSKGFKVLRKMTDKWLKGNPTKPQELALHHFLLS